MQPTPEIRKSIAQLVFILILLTLGFRVVRFTADPPADFSWSGGYFADEGYWAHNARNEVLFGNAVQDEWDARVVSPVFAGAQRLVFGAFGVGIAQVRLIGLFSSILLALCSFFLLREPYGEGPAFLGSLLLSLSFPMLVLGRQGILDPFAAGLAWLALLLALLGSAPAALAAGILITAACTTKYLMIYALIPMVYTFLSGDSRKNLAWFIGGCTAALLAWLVLNYWPHREQLLAYSRFYSSQQSWNPRAVLQNIIQQPFYLYFSRTPAVLFFGNLMIWYWFANFRKAQRLEKIVWLWLVCGVIFFSLWRYRPERYYTSLLPPMAALAGMCLVRIREVSDNFRTGRTPMWLAIGLLLPAVQFVFLIFDALLNWRIVPSEAHIQMADAFIFLALTAITPFLLIKKKPIRIFVSVFFVAFLLGDMRSYMQWVLNPQYNAVEISQDLQKRIGTGVLTGQWAPELCLENHLRAVPVWYGFVNSDRPFEKYGITHLLLWRYPLGDETKKFKQWYPQDFQKYKPVAEYKIKDSALVLYERKSP